jgi:hypothetical protein
MVLNRHLSQVFQNPRLETESLRSAMKSIERYTDSRLYWHRTRSLNMGFVRDTCLEQIIAFQTSEKEVPLNPCDDLRTFLATRHRLEAILTFTYFEIP